MGVTPYESVIMQCLLLPSHEAAVFLLHARRECQDEEDTEAAVAEAKASPLRSCLCRAFITLRLSSKDPDSKPGLVVGYLQTLC